MTDKINNENGKLYQYQCPHCVKIFKQQSNLINHIAVHKHIKPHACKFCKKKFRQKGHLKYHEEHIHKNIHRSRGSQDSSQFNQPNFDINNIHGI